MVFSSNLFLFIFLPAVLFLYYLAPRRMRFIVLTLSSYLFYAWSDPRFILLLIWVTICDFVIGNLIGGHWRISPSRPPPPGFKKFLLALSLTNSLGLLFFFKYAMFAQELANYWRNTFGSKAVPVLAIVLPAGISFYTFESISYIVDIYRGIAHPASVRFLNAIPPEKRNRKTRWLAELRAFSAFATYLTQFPHLVAGPIVRYQELESQLDRPHTSLDRFTRGIFFLSIGLAKKVLIANTVAGAADTAFAANSLNVADAWWGTFAYAFQIYFDFSGYTDMAIGLALMVGFDFPRNFDSPYKSISITDFWRRWHITLSTWLRDYLYIPLGGNRKGHVRTYVNLILTMFLGGLWHGASLNFAVWGVYHGSLLAMERFFKFGHHESRVPKIARVALTFALVCIGWVPFRADGLKHTLTYLAMLFPHKVHTPDDFHAGLFEPATVTMMLVGAAIAFFGIQTWELARRITPLKAIAAIVLFIVSVITLADSASSPFLYFRF